MGSDKGNGVGLGGMGLDWGGEQGRTGGRTGSDWGGNGVRLGGTGSDWRETGSDWGERGRAGGTGSNWQETGSDWGEHGRTGGNGVELGERGRTGRERGSDWMGTGVRLDENGGRTCREQGRTRREQGSELRGTRSDWWVGLGGSDWGIRGGASSFGPTLCLRCAQTARLYVKHGCAGCTGKKSPLRAVIPFRELLSSTVLSLLFTFFLAILRKLGLVDILVRLTNKLYPTQHYFGVYAWMFL